MTDQEYRKLRFEYWKLLVAQKANVDEFGEKNPNLEQRKMQMEEVFWTLGKGVPAYDDMEYLIANQKWQFNLDHRVMRYCNFWHVGKSAYKDMDKLIQNQIWRFNINHDFARYYTFIDNNGKIGKAVDHVPDDLIRFVDQKENCIR